MAEKQRESGGTQAPAYTPIGLRVYDFMHEKCRDYGDKPAISCYDKSISYAQLLEKIDQTASALLAMGVQKGDVVAVALPSIPEGIYLIFARRYRIDR